jgi:hypothetical protein
MIQNQGQFFMMQHSSEPRNPNPHIMQTEPLTGFWSIACSNGDAKHCARFEDESYPKVKYGVATDLQSLFGLLCRAVLIR